MGGSLSRSDGRSRNDSGFEAEITRTVKRDYGFPDVGLHFLLLLCDRAAKAPKYQFRRLFPFILLLSVSSLCPSWE